MLTGGGDGMGGMQQRIGGDATLVQADTAETLVALDKDNFLAEVRRVKGRRITARPGADNYNFSFDWVHGEKMESWSDGVLE